MVKAPPATCATHRHRDRVATCGSCDNALCADCVVHTSVGIKCPRCTGAKATGVRVGAHAPTGSSGAAEAGKRRSWVVALVAAGVLVLGVGIYAVRSGGSGSSSGPVTSGQPLSLAPTATERNADFVGAGGTRMTGTLTLPGTAPGQRSVPAVLIVGGLGAIDRNAATAAGASGEAGALGSTFSTSAPGPVDPLYQNLSEALAKAGVASFRYDKRGTGASRSKADQKLSFADEVADARADLAILAQRQEVGGAPLGLLGHDTGGVVAMRLAASNPRVKAAVLVSTPARPLAEVIADDLVQSAGPGLSDQFRAAVSALLASGRPPAPGTLPPALQPLFPAAQEGYLKSLLSLDPVAEAHAVGVPALVVRGGADQSVSASDGDRFVSAMAPGTDVMVGAKGSDHNLAVATEGHVHANNGAAVKAADNRDNDLTARLSAWVKTRLST